MIRNKALLVFDKISKLSNEYITNPVTRYIFEKMIKPRVEHLIKNVIPESRLKQALQDSFNEIKPVVEEVQLATQLKESIKLNSPEMNKKLMKLPDFEKALSLIDEL